MSVPVPGDAPSGAGAIDLVEIAAFAWREAELLDTPDYPRWLDLWSSDGRYIVPVEQSATGYEDKLNILFDDDALRRARVKRLRSGFSMSSAPAARTVRTVSRFVPIDAPAGEFAVRCAQHIVEYKYERSRLLAADVTYRVRREDVGLRMVEKVVLLINSDDALHGIGYLL